MKDQWIDKAEMNHLLNNLGNRPIYGPQPDDIFDDMPFSQGQPRPEQNPASLQMPVPHGMMPPVQQSFSHPQQPPVYQPPHQALPIIYPQPPYPNSQPPYPNYQHPAWYQQHQPQAAPVSPYPPHFAQPPSFPVIISQQSAGVPASSPFSLDEDELEFDEIEERIGHLTAEAEKALIALREVRERAETNGLIARSAQGPYSTAVKPVLFEPDDEPDRPPKDRIPLDAEIDPYLSLKDRLLALAKILSDSVGMVEMLVVDRDGFILFQTTPCDGVNRSVGPFLKIVREIFQAANGRKHSASQFVVGENQWFCILPSEGKVAGRFLLKVLVPEPLDKPEIYTLLELFNETLRPESA